MTLVDVGCAFVQMQCPVQHMNMVAEFSLELLDELGDDVQQILRRSVFIQRSKLVNSLFRAGLAAGQQVGNRAVALRVPDFGIALVLAFHKNRVVGFVELRSTSEKVAARSSVSCGARAERKPWKQSQ